MASLPNGPAVLPANFPRLVAVPPPPPPAPVIQIPAAVWNVGVVDIPELPLHLRRGAAVVIPALPMAVPNLPGAAAVAPPALPVMGGLVPVGSMTPPNLPGAAAVAPVVVPTVVVLPNQISMRLVEVLLGRLVSFSGTRFDKREFNLSRITQFTSYPHQTQLLAAIEKVGNIVTVSPARYAPLDGEGTTFRMYVRVERTGDEDLLFEFCLGVHGIALELAIDTLKSTNKAHMMKFLERSGSFGRGFWEIHREVRDSVLHF